MERSSQTAIERSGGRCQLRLPGCTAVATAAHDNARAEFDVLQSSVSSVRSVHPRTILSASVIGGAGQLLSEAGPPGTAVA